MSLIDSLMFAVGVGGLLLLEMFLLRF